MSGGYLDELFLLLDGTRCVSVNDIENVCKVSGGNIKDVCEGNIYVGVMTMFGRFLDVIFLLFCY